MSPSPSFPIQKDEPNSPTQVAAPDHIVDMNSAFEQLGQEMMELGPENTEAPATVESGAIAASDHIVNMNSAFEQLGQEMMETIALLGPENTEAPAFLESGASGSEWEKYLPLYKATLGGDWKKAEMILNADENAIKSSIAHTTETTLHAAIGTGKAINFVQNLVRRMPDSLLGIPTKDGGVTPLHVAALAGNTNAAKILVARRPDLVYERTPAGLLPLHFAAESGHRETLVYLISKTHNRNDVYSHQSGLKLLIHTIDAGFYDVALHLANSYPHLAKLRDDQNGTSALQKIASKVYVFSRPRQHFNFWGRFSYLKMKANVGHEKDLIREKALQLVKCLCKNMQDPNDLEVKSIYSDAMIEAVHCGTSEAIKVILAAFPETIITTMRKRESFIFGLGVENRCEIVFHLIFRTSCLGRRKYLGNLDFENNNILHRTAKLAPLHKLNLVSGAALQMQREMQWYKEVENLLTPYNREVKNKYEQTPWMVFKEQHSQLKAEGENWIKVTANSCSIAAALIATVVFAAAITVPGGNKEESGLPFFSGQRAFVLFAVSDAISLFTSITSLLMFLAILTSRCAEEDFLYALPKRLIIGFLSLFISVMFMMVAFGATLYVVFGKKDPEIIIPVLIVLGCLPVTSFVLLQFPLLWDVISNTYGRGNLGKQIERLKI